MYLASTIGTIHEGKTREHADSKFIITNEVKNLYNFATCVSKDYLPYVEIIMLLYAKKFFLLL